jgi:Cytochrome P460
MSGPAPNYLKMVCVATTMTLAIFCGCAAPQPRIVAIINQSASLSGRLPANPLEWKIISSAVDTKKATMSTLYGNDVAVQYARTNAQHDYPSGSAVSLVTWSQQEDARWFGGKIPDQAKAVEFVFVGTDAHGRPSYSYQVYEGAPLRKASEENSSAPSGRAAELLSQRAAVLP